MRSTLLLLIIILSIIPVKARSENKEYRVIIKDHLFIPSVVTIPANTKVKLVIVNQDNTPEEFESYELNREKIIMGNRKANIFIGPLPPGKYPFFGEFNPKTAQGMVVVENTEVKLDVE